MSEYDQILERYTSRAMPIIDNHRLQVQGLKDRDPSGDLDEQREHEERQDQYMNQVWPSIDEQWGEAASDFVVEVEQLRASLEEKVYGGDKSASGHLTALAAVPDERLPELMETAAAAGDEGLRRAVMLTARERGLRGIVNRFIDGDPERRAAYEQLNSLPEQDRLEGIAKGYKPPKAAPESLRPSQQARERAAARARGQQSTRSGFFGGR